MAVVNPSVPKSDHIYAKYAFHAATWITIDVVLSMDVKLQVNLAYKMML